MERNQNERCEIKLFLLKALIMGLSFIAFFSLLSVYNPQLLRLSRTAGVTMLTYGILLITLSGVYRAFEFGRKDRMHTINTSSVTVWLTDAITYFQLLIMNFNEDNRSSLMPVAGEVAYLIVAMIIQYALIALVTRWALNIYARSHPPRRACLICRTEADARQIRDRLSAYPRRFQLVKIFLYPRLSLFEELEEYGQVFLYNLPYQERQAIIDYCYKISKPVSYSMEIADIIGYGAEHDMFGDMSFISADNRRALTLEQRMIKRLMDVAVGSILLVLASPFMLVSAAAIYLEDRGRVFFLQPRATIGGRVFTIYKFRTMYEGAEDSVSVHAQDHRITRVGRVLRRLRLDELPQLFNVLMGDMSLVGPRPEMLKNVQSYTQEMPEFSYRLAVKAGLTGYAQISGKYNTAPRDKMLMDLMYIEDYNIWRDFKLLFKTVTVIFRADSTEAFEQPLPEEIPEEKRTQAM